MAFPGVSTSWVDSTHLKKIGASQFGSFPGCKINQQLGFGMFRVSKKNTTLTYADTEIQLYEFTRPERSTQVLVGGFGGPKFRERSQVSLSLLAIVV